MNTVKGRLQISAAKKITVILPTKKGEAPFQIPFLAKCFRDEDAQDGLEVDVVRDDNGKIIKVTIPGKEEVVGKSVYSDRQKHVGGGRLQGRTQYQNPQYNPGSSANAVSPSIIGEPFHNPYTFIDFETSPPSRQTPTSCTADEASGSTRFTGIIELEVNTKSPLLTSLPDSNHDNRRGHKSYRALTIGNDVILPATGVRGALRNLLTIITGGPLATVDKEMYLCQQRDLPLALHPTTQQAPCCLAKVSKAGNHTQSGTLQLGETKLVQVALLKMLKGLDLDKKRPTTDRQTLWIDNPDNPTRWSNNKTSECPWQVKLSGRPVNTQPKKSYIDSLVQPIAWSGMKTEKCAIEITCHRGHNRHENIAKHKGQTITLPPEFWDAWLVGFKKEGAFLASSDELVEVKSELWQAYANRNRHGVRSELKKGDLVWLELNDQNDVISIQWARWGRKGTKLTEILPRSVLPDYMQEDGLVSTVTNLFGQVPTDESNALIFAGRVRPDNLVFVDGKDRLTNILPLAVLASPHPGCLPFYRKDEPHTVSKQSPLRGYKVYRTSKHNESEEDPEAPWKYGKQGVYDDGGELKGDGSDSTVNFSAQLLKAGATGNVQLSVRSLTWEEMSLIRLVCEGAVWRLGGGKPLGLGHCHVKIVKVLDEFGTEIHKNDERWTDPPSSIKQCFETWSAMQKPVETLRYPRAVILNRNKNNRAGLSWFQKLATPKKNQRGMQMVQTDKGEVNGQMLPEFRTDLNDFLYGYDVVLDDGVKRKTGVYSVPLEKFDPAQHVSGDEQSGGFHGQNRGTRQQTRQYR